MEFPTVMITEKKQQTNKQEHKKTMFQLYCELNTLHAKQL